MGEGRLKRLWFLVVTVFGLALSSGGVYLVSKGVWIGLYFVLIGSLVSVTPVLFSLMFRRAEG